MGIEGMVTTKEAAKQLGISMRGVQKLLERGRLKGELVANHWLVYQESIDSWPDRKVGKHE